MYNMTQRSWGTICDIHVVKEGWPSVVCKQLGFAKAIKIEKRKTKPGVPKIFNGPYAFKCPKCSPSNADSMEECGKDKVQFCDHNSDVFVTCAPHPPTPKMKVKLVAGRSRNEGFAMMYNMTQRSWGTICDIHVVKEGWPSVVCKQLGFAKAIKIEKRKTKPGVQKIFKGPYAFKCPKCSPSNADSMEECGKDKVQICDHNSDVYVTCAPLGSMQNDASVNTKDKIDLKEDSEMSSVKDKRDDSKTKSDKVKKLRMVKLVGGKRKSEGFAMMYNTTLKRWGTICDIHVVAHGWPSVLCKEMGFEKAEKIEKRKSKDGVAKTVCKRIAFKCPACSPENADTMASCGKDKVQICDHDDDVYVTCTEKNTCSSIDGQCVKGNKCGKGYRSAKSQGKDGKCPRDAQGNRYKCCVKVEEKRETCSAIGGKCMKGSRCGEGFKSAHSQGKEGKCLPDATGNKYKCCLKVAEEDKGTPCPEVGGSCMKKTDGRCPDGFKSQKSGFCPGKGNKCCIKK